MIGVLPIPVSDDFPEPSGALPREAALELLFFGLVRPYKGLDLALDAVPHEDVPPGQHRHGVRALPRFLDEGHMHDVGLQVHDLGRERHQRGHGDQNPQGDRDEPGDENGL
ncbi:MAG: hypothetical protein IIA23_08135 [Chloroflexi bacterium]|nr:hypothetical protein [Chloroflexota bacterium]